MSCKQATTLLLVAIVLTTVNPLANAIITSNLVTVNVGSRLCCTSNGNCGLLNSNGMAGVTVLVTCTNFQGVTITVSQGITDTFGGIANAATNLIGINAAIPCNAIVPLPLDASVCPLLSTATGMIRGIIVPLRIDIVSSVGLNTSVAQTAATTGLFVRSN